MYGLVAVFFKTASMVLAELCKYGGVALLSIYFSVVLNSQCIFVCVCVCLFVCPLFRGKTNNMISFISVYDRIFQSINLLRFPYQIVCLHSLKFLLIIFALFSLIS